MGLVLSLASNPVLVGIVGGMMTGSLLYLLKATPRLLLTALVRAVTVKLTISSEEEVFDWVNDWLSRHEYTKTARRLKISSRSVQTDWVLAPGYGRHLLWEAGRPILAERELESTQNKLWGRPAEKITLTSLGRSQAQLRAAIDQANALRQKRDKLEVRLWQNGYWQAPYRVGLPRGWPTRGASRRRQVVLLGGV